MHEVRANLFKAVDADAICITTNGDVNKRGEAVMGAGVAKTAKELYPVLPRILARSLELTGNHVISLGKHGGIELISFPVKHHWNQKADLELIRRSCYELWRMADVRGWKKVGLPRAGCGNGKLRWEEVKPILQMELDDRFWVVDYATGT